MADFPSIEPDSEEIALIANNQVYNSPLTGQAQTASLTGAKWQCTPTFSNRNGKEARDLRAFLFNQEGVSGRFNYYPASIDNIGTHAGGGVVDGAGQTGKSLLTKGWDADQPLLFSAGDYLTVNGEMKMVTADVVTSAATYIEYEETNYTTIPYTTSSWIGASDTDVSYNKITVTNPSGQATVGEFEYIGPASFQLFVSPFGSNEPIGTDFYFSMLIKPTNTADGLQLFFQYNDGATTGTDETININITDGTYSTQAGGGAVFATKTTAIIDGYYILQVHYKSLTPYKYRIFVYGAVDIGNKLTCQAVFFGKANDWPAKLRANATIPITPAIRVSPSDENAIEVENPYFPARLDTDDMSRLQVSAPVIYNTTLSIVEDF